MKQPTDPRSVEAMRIAAYFNSGKTNYTVICINMHRLLILLCLRQIGLEQLADSTDAPSGEAYVSVSCWKPVLQLVSEEILQPEDADTERTKN